MLYGLAGAIAALLGFIHIQGDVHPIHRDAREQQIKYEHNLAKQAEKEKYERSLLDYKKPNAYMTVEEYEAKSAPQDRYTEKVEIPKAEKGTDMKYVPQPTYKIVRYNNPPGTPELSIKQDFYKKRIQNMQGIVSPDYSIMVYPTMYYYPVSNSTGTDLFVVRLDPNETNLNKILKAHVTHRMPTPILSTDTANENNAAFRSLTPVDFSADGRKILVKEKIGSSYDGIWKTNAIVYDFDNNNSYNLLEVRDAIIYYWKENKGMDLDDKRWDIYPLGFIVSEPDRVAVCAYAYTGDTPVFLGVWSVDIHGEQSRLISFDMKEVEVGMNGFKVVQDGVVAPIVLENEEKAMRKIEKADKKAKKKEIKETEKAMKDAYKAKIKEMDEAYRERKSDFQKFQSINGTTSGNEIPVQFKEYKIKQLTKEINMLEKQNEKDLRFIQKIDKEIQNLDKKINPAEKL